MKFRNQVVDYFSFNRAEQRGISVLLFILTGLIIANLVIPERTEITEKEFAAFDKDITRFEKDLKIAAEQEQADRNSRNSRYSRNYSTYSKTDTMERTKTKPVISFTIELNSADTLELQRLKGIGPAFARRIVNYRERLGGFVRTTQVKEVFGMDSVRFRLISPNIAVNPSLIKKIDINNVTFKELMRHPYFPYELTREIILTRKKMKKFGSYDDIRTVPGINDTTFYKIKAYIEII
jgi:competence ComEA-like helix-hairpin-helix protein